MPLIETKLMENEIMIIRKIALAFGLIPWLFLLSFYSLIIRFKLIYYLLPPARPIDPKEIGMPIHTGVIYGLFILLLAAIPIIVYSTITSIVKRKKKHSLYFIFCLIGLLVCFYVLMNSKIMDWYFD